MPQDKDKVKAQNWRWTGAQRQLNARTVSRKLLLMAFGAIGFGCQAKGFLAVMTDRAILSFGMVRLGYFYFLLHLENFCMAGVTFRIRYLHVCFMAEKDRSLLLGFILYIPSAHFLLCESHTQGRKAYDADTDYHNSPEFIAHFLTSFLSIFSFA
jgi:hypothetical protein